MKSLTGRTEVKATVSPAGDVDIQVLRSGCTVHSFSIGREQDIPKSASLSKDKGDVVVVMDGKEVDRIPVV